MKRELRELHWCAKKLSLVVHFFVHFCRSIAILVKHFRDSFNLFFRNAFRHGYECGGGGGGQSQSQIESVLRRKLEKVK